MFNHQSFLLSKLLEYKKINHRYSLRSFAKKLKMSPSHLSSLIHGRRKLTSMQVSKISSALDLDSDATFQLLQQALPEELQSKHNSYEFQLLAEDQLKLISHWSHFAILSLGQIKNNKPHPKWIAEKLGLHVHEALDAFLRLKRMGLLSEENGHFRQTSKPLATSRDIPSEVIKNFHKENLRIAAEKIDSVPVRAREFAAVTLAINPKKIDRAKKLIQDLQIKLCDELEDQNCSEVYTLAIQFFPLTQENR